MKNRKLVAYVKLRAKLHEEFLVISTPTFLKGFLLSFIWFVDLFTFRVLFPVA